MELPLDKLFKSVNTPESIYNIVHVNPDGNILFDFPVLFNYVGKLMGKAEKLYKNGDERKQAILKILEYLIIKTGCENRTQMMEIVENVISPFIDQIVGISKVINVKSLWCC